jgi:hypothetical protein
MPHVMCSGHVDLERAWRDFPLGPWRWGNAVGKVEGRYLGHNARALLIAGVVVEFGRPIHPVVVISHNPNGTGFHLWQGAPVERTDAVKRFLAQVAREAVAFGCGEVSQTNLPDLA